MRGSLYGASLLTAAVLLATACSWRPSVPISETFNSMGTVARVTVGPQDRERLPQLTAEVHKEFSTLEDLLSTYQPDSEISRLAARAGQAPVRVSAETYRVLELARHYGELTDGAFDVTVAPLVRLWGVGLKPPDHVPSPDEIRTRLQLVDFRRIELNDGTAHLPAGMSVDLGGIGKGYAVDRAFDIAGRLQIDSAMVDLGGNIRTVGQAEPGVNWTIGVRNPFEREVIVGKLSLAAGMAVATSGNYERFVELGGRRYSHIIDPRTGYPVEGMAGVTVVAPDATMTDGLSTGLFVLGAAKGKELLRRVPSANALFIPDKSPIEIWITPGMKAVFVPLPEFSSSVRILN